MHDTNQNITPDTPEELIEEQRSLKERKNEIEEEIAEINQRLKNGETHPGLYNRKADLGSEARRINTDLLGVTADLAALQRKMEFREMRVRAVRQITCAYIAAGFDTNECVGYAIATEHRIQQAVP